MRPLMLVIAHALLLVVSAAVAGMRIGATVVGVAIPVTDPERHEAVLRHVRKRGLVGRHTPCRPPGRNALKRPS